MCVNSLPACMSVQHFYAWCSWRPEGTAFSGIGVMDGCGLPHWCWDLNLGLQEKQLVLLTKLHPSQMMKCTQIDCQNYRTVD